MRSDPKDMNAMILKSNIPGRGACASAPGGSHEAVNNRNFLNFTERATEMELPLRTVRANIVQSIRAYRPHDLQEAAAQLGHHFFYVNLAHAQSRQDALDTMVESFLLPQQATRNFDAIKSCLSDQLYKAGPQPGFIVVLEQIPAHARFDKEVREQLLDLFRDAAEYWNDRKIPFRCFYSFL